MAALSCESLEARQLLATLIWNGTNPGDVNWSTAANWLDNGNPAVPAADDTLVFSNASPAIVTAPNNDLAAGTRFQLEFGTGGYLLTGNEVAISGPDAVRAVNPSGPNILELPLLLTGDATIFQGAGPNTLFLRSPLSGGGGTVLTKAGVGAVVTEGPNTFAGTTSVDAGTLIVASNLGVISLNGGVIAGEGTVGSITATAAGGRISPGRSPSIINSGTVVLNPASSLVVELDGPIVGTQYDQLNVTGNVTLGGSTLNVLLGYIPGPTDSYTIIDNDSTDPIQGTFAGLPQGASFTVATTQFRISYIGGDGNDVVISANGAPVAADDFFTLPESTAANPIFVVPAPGVLANDTDPNGDAIRPILVAGPVNGTLSLSGDGSFTYEPSPGFSGADSFTYLVSDGTLQSNTATVSLIVNAVNEAPVAAADSYSILGNTVVAIAAPGILSNDFSPDGLALTTELVANTDHGSVALNADGSFTYTPETDFVGATSFSYRARDTNGLGSAVTSVTLNIGVLNVAPAANGETFNATEDKTLSVVAPGVLANDTDGNAGDTLSAFLITAPLNGSLSLRGDGSFDYTPNPDFSGVDTFTYRVTDGQLSSPADATVTINVAAVNDAPVATNDAYTGTEDTPLVIAAPGVLANDTDIDGDVLTAVLVNGPQHGTLALNADGSFTYTPNADYSGPDSFTYRASDGALSSNLATVDLTITAVNDAPVAVDDTGVGGGSFTTAEDTVLTVSAPGVLQNDVDAEGDTLSAVLLTGPGNGSLVLNSDGSFTYTPFANYSGPDSFTYRASDGSLFSAPATVLLNVTAVNDAPVATNDVYATNENTALVVADIGVLINDTDAEADTLAAILVNGPIHGTLALSGAGGFTYTPNANFSGTDTFTYRAVDPSLGVSNIATVTINVEAVNNPPVANDDTGVGSGFYSTAEGTVLTVSAPGVLQNDTDADADTLSAVVLVGPTNGTLVLNSDGSFTYTPFATFSGTDSFTYRASDGSLFSAPATVSLLITTVNDAPVATNDIYSTSEATTLIVGDIGVLANDTDADGDPLTAVLVNGVQQGTLTLNPGGGFTYTPNPLFTGTDSFSYRARDASGLLSNVASVTINVEVVNDPPVANDDPGIGGGAYTTAENTVLTISAPGVLQNDTDTEGDTLSAVLVVGPTNGSLVLNTNGSFTYTPFANYSGPDSFTYRASDGQQLSNVATVSILVTGVAQAPIANPDSYRLREDATLSIAAPGVLLNDVNVDNTPLTVTVINGPLNGTVTLNNDGSFTYVPDANFSGSDSFTYFLTQAVPGGLRSNATTVTLTIQAANDAPVVANQTYTTNENITLEVASPGVLFSAGDNDGDLLSSFIVDGPFNGVVSLQSNGAFLYQPNAFYNGPDTFTFRASDGKLSSNLGTVTINVRPVATPPSAQDDAYTTQADLRLVVGAPAGILANDFNIDGQPLTVVLVSPTLNGTLQLGTNGTFTYTPNPQFVGVDSFSYRASNGVNQSNLAVVTITVTPKVATTAQLDPASDTGQSGTDRITNDSTPTFSGTTIPNLRVLLYAQPAGASSAILVGVTTSDSSGSYAVTSSPLADGQYRFFTEALRADGLSTGRVDAGLLTIDTVAPRVTDVVLNPKTGQIYVTYQDDRVGMSATSTLDTRNYVFTKKFTVHPRADFISAVRGLPASGQPTSETVVLRSRDGRAVRHGRYLFRILSGGVADIAGNALDGEFNGSFPSGNGVAGGDFQGQFNNGGKIRSVPVNFPGFIPVVTQGQVPSGPIARAKAAAKKGK